MPSETAKKAARNAGLSGADVRTVGIAVDAAYALLVEASETLEKQLEYFGTSELRGSSFFIVTHAARERVAAELAKAKGDAECQPATS